MRSPLKAIFNSTPISYASRSLSFPFVFHNSPEAQMRAMGSVGTLFAIVSVLANETALVDWKLYRKARSGLDEDRVEVTKHLALDIWNKPNQFFPRQEFVETFQQHLDLTGEAWWVVGRDDRARSIPLSLWPVRPDRMAPIPSPREFISGYEYTGPNGEKIPLRLDEVIFLRMPNPLDPYRGMGPVQSIMADLDSTKYSSEWNRNFFINGAEPGGIIEVGQRLGDTEFNELRDRWEEQHRGVSNAHRVALLEQGKWVERKYTNRDMQFVELRSVSRDIIREAFAFHGHKLGLSENINRANAEAADVTFARGHIVPRLERIKGALNNDFLPLFGPNGDLEFDYCNPVPEDREAENKERESKATAAEKLIGIGFDPAEVCEYLGLPEMKFEKKEVPPQLQPNIPSEEEGTDDQAVTNLLRKVLRGEVDPKVLTDQLNERTEELIEEATEQIQVDWEDAINQLLERWGPITDAQRKQLVDQIRLAVDRGDVKALSALTCSTIESTEVLTQAMVDMFGLGAESIIDEAIRQRVPDVQPADPPENELSLVATAVAALLATGLASYAGKEALRRATGDTSGQEVADAVDEAIRGLSDRSLRDNLGGALTTAQNAGRIATMQTAPDAVWHASERNDKNACEPCRNVDGKTFDTLTEAHGKYPNGGYVDCLGGVRCRGTIVPIWEGL